MERDLLVERPQSDLARAKAEGKTLGRPTKTSESQRVEIVAMREAGASISSLSRTYGNSRASIMRVTGDF